MALSRALDRQQQIPTSSDTPATTPVTNVRNTLMAAASDDSKKDGTPAQPLLAPTAVLNLSDTDVYIIPVVNKGYIWNTWSPQTKAVKKELEEQEKFLLELQKTSMALGARISRFDEGTATLVDGITFVTAAFSVALTALSASDALSESAYKNVQIAVSAVTAGFSLFSNLVSRRVTAKRNQALEYKGDVDELIAALKTTYTKK